MLDTALQYQHYWGKKQHSPLKLSRKFTGHRVDSVNASAWNILTWFVWIVCIHSYNLDLFLVFHVFRWGAISLDKQCHGSFLKHIPLPFQSCSSVTGNLTKSNSLQGTEAKIPKTNQRGICITREFYCSKKVTCMPQVLKGKRQFSLQTWASSSAPENLMAFLFWLLSSSLKGVVYSVVATPLARSPPLLNSWCTKEHAVPLSIPPVSGPDQLEEADTPENRKRKIFPDLCESRGQKLLFLECRPVVWHFYFTLTHINLSNLCIYSGYF